MGQNRGLKRTEQATKQVKLPSFRLPEVLLLWFLNVYIKYRRPPSSTPLKKGIRPVYPWGQGISPPKSSSMEANHRVSPPKWQSETHDETSQPSNTVPIQKIKGLLFLWPHPSTQNKMDLLDLYSRYGLKDPPKGVRPKEFHPDEFHGSHGRRLLYCIYIYI